MKFSELTAFEDLLKSRITVGELYTRETGHEFVKIGGVLCAIVAWRDDHKPSLIFRPERGLLTDYASGVQTYHGKAGEIFNHLDLLVKLGKANTRYEAIGVLAEIVGEQLPKGMKTVFEKLSREQSGLRAIWAKCLEYTKTVLADPEHFPLVQQVCEERHIPYDIEFWQKMNIAIWPSAAHINPIIEEFKLRDKDSKLPFNVQMGFESRAIVFPLHNKNNAFVGVTIRGLGDKKFLKYSLDEQGAYGLQTVLAEEKVIVTEGQMNVLQIAAATYRQYGTKKDDHGVEEWKNYLPPMFATGSRNYRMSELKGLWEEVLYAPDFDKKLLQGDKKIEVYHTVVKIYNDLGIGTPFFYVISWDDAEAFDKYDIDDFLREHIGREKEAFEKIKKLSSKIYEFLFDCIEVKTKALKEGTPRDSARWSFATGFAQSLHNRVDSNALLALYHFDPETLDPEVIEETTFGERHSLGHGLSVFRNAYWHTKMENGEEGETKQISNFVFSPRYKIITKPPEKSHVGEHERRTDEIRSTHAIVLFEDRTQHPVTFEYKDLVDIKSFVTAMARMVMKAREHIPTIGDELSYVFQAAMIGLRTETEIIRLEAAGPHLRMDTPEHRRDTLRPDWFGPTIKTYLSRGYSVINGKIVKNRDVNLEFVSANPYSFDVYSDQEHARISHLVWHKLRHMHYKWYIDSMLGLAAMTPIKHLLAPNLNGTVAILIGKTNAHKTSTGLIMSNFFGDIASDNQLQSFNSTPKAFEQRVAKAGSVYLICDEFKSTPEFTVKHLSTIIHNMYGGRSRDRLTSGSKLSETYEFTGTYVMTGEQLAEIGSSTEARCLVYRVEEFNAKEVYDEMMLPENLENLKCWMPRLIVWEHENTDELIEFYKERCIDQRNRLNNIANANRIAGQQALVETGFYAVARYMEVMQVITHEERKAAVQEYLIWSNSDIFKQMSRSEDTSNANKFLQYVREMIDTNAVNIAIIEGDGQKKEVRFSQEQKKKYSIIRFESRGELKYVFPSFDSFISEVNNFSGQKDGLLTSIRKDLAELGLVKLDHKSGFQSIEFPDPQNIKGKKKRLRALILTHKDIYGDIERDNISPDREH